MAWLPRVRVRQCAMVNRSPSAAHFLTLDFQPLSALPVAAVGAFRHEKGAVFRGPPQVEIQRCSMTPI
jgi:hypothetical protein